MEFCDQPWNFTNFVPNNTVFATTKKLDIAVESQHFPTFSSKCRKCKMEKGDGQENLRNGHGKVMGKYFVKSLGNLNQH